jgi:hypothetical protein
VTFAAWTISSADDIICALVIVAVGVVVVVAAETKNDGCGWNNILLNPALQLLVVPAARSERYNGGWRCCRVAGADVYADAGADEDVYAGVNGDDSVVVVVVVDVHSDVNAGADERSFRPTKRNELLSLFVRFTAPSSSSAAAAAGGGAAVSAQCALRMRMR